ncbi:MAG: hypothetical protein ACFB22_13820 [Rhodothalassiaceae bacterium]
MNRNVVNQRVLDLLDRFGSVDTAALLAEAQAVNESQILTSGVLTNNRGQVQIQLVWLMEGLLTLALGGKPTMAMPKDINLVRDALVLFVKLNHTDTFGFTSTDTPEKWAFRVLDTLFQMFADNDLLDARDRLMLLRVSENSLWQTAFSYALHLYTIATTKGPEFIREVDKPAIQSTLRSFKSAVELRRARMPKMKYANPTATFQDIAEFAIGQYLDGMDVNDALGQTLVQAQLGTLGDEGKKRFRQFLDKNRITTEQFPTTVNELYRLVATSIQFQETEEEVSNALFAFSHKIGQDKQMQVMFGNFVEAAFPAAAKCSRLLSFAGFDLEEGANFIARWMSSCSMLNEERKADTRAHVETVLKYLGREEKRNLMAFREGRTRTADITKQVISDYCQMRTTLLELNALNQKMQRVEAALMQQMERTEHFVTRPGKDILQDMTYGIHEFFKTLKIVFRDIFEMADKSRQTKVRKLEEFNKTYGPLSTVSLLVPRDPKMPMGRWLERAQRKLSDVPYYVFEV